MRIFLNSDIFYFQVISFDWIQWKSGWKFRNSISAVSKNSTPLFPEAEFGSQAHQVKIIGLSPRYGTLLGTKSRKLSGFEVLSRQGLDYYFQPSLISAENIHNCTLAYFSSLQNGHILLNFVYFVSKFGAVAMATSTNTKNLIYILCLEMKSTDPPLWFGRS